MAQMSATTNPIPPGEAVWPVDHRQGHAMRANHVILFCSFSSFPRMRGGEVRAKHGQARTRTIPGHAFGRGGAWTGNAGEVRHAVPMPPISKAPNPRRVPAEPIRRRTPPSIEKQSAWDFRSSKCHSWPGTPKGIARSRAAESLRSRFTVAPRTNESVPGGKLPRRPKMCETD